MVICIRIGEGLRVKGRVNITAQRSRYNSISDTILLTRAECLWCKYLNIKTIYLDNCLVEAGSFRKTYLRCKFFLHVARAELCAQISSKISQFLFSTFQ